MFDCDKIKEKKSRRYLYDLCLLAAIILSALIWMAVAYFLRQSAAAVTVSYENDGRQSEQTYTIDPDRTFDLIFYYDEEQSSYMIHEVSTGEDLSAYTDNDYNYISISPDGVKVTDADCPDLTCVHTKKASKDGEQIICLPHKLVITVEASNNEENLDAVTW